MKDIKFFRKKPKALDDEFIAEKAPEGSLFKQAGFFLLELVKIIIVCAAIILPVRMLAVQPFSVTGGSMEPNFHDGEYLIIYQLPYQLHHISDKLAANLTGKDRGYPLVFRYPKDPKQFFIKRLIALPGERVNIENGKIYIYNTDYPDGFELDESSYLGEDVYTAAGSFNNIILKDDEVFVLGDHRNASLDSRRFGSFEIKYIVGRPVFVGWPFDKAGIVKKPEYIGN